MGRRVLKSGQIDKSQRLFSSAAQQQLDIYGLIVAIESFVNDNVLSGKAYSNAKGYLNSIQVPANKALCMTLENEISASEEVINCCNTHLNGIDFIDEECIQSEIRRLEQDIEQLRDDWWDLLPIVRQINNLIIENKYSQIRRMQEELEKLDAYDNATSELYNNAITQVTVISQKMNEISSLSVWTGNCFNYAGIDMSWAYTLADSWDQSECNVMCKYEYNIQEEFGFDSKTVTIIRQMHKSLKKNYPNASQSELDWRFSRLLGGLVYDDNGKFSSFKWCDVAGVAIDKGELTEKDYFKNVLGIGENDYELLRYKVRIHYQISSDEKKGVELPDSINDLKIEDKDKLKQWMSKYRSATGIELSDEELVSEKSLQIWNEQYKSFRNKGDFAHQQITTSAILAEQLGKEGVISNIWLRADDKTVTEKAGWLGDATLNNPPSFNNDDYISDLDAKNITTYMDRNKMSYIEASNLYYKDLKEGASRAEIFLRDTPLQEVKKKIYTDLVYPKVTSKVQQAVTKRDEEGVRAAASLYADDDYAMNMLKKEAPDTYNFIRSLEEGYSTMGDFQ